MKGQQEIITPLLITAILIAVVGSVYMWGVPLIQKNQDMAKLQKAENFMRNLNEKIKNVANTGGRDKITVETGTITFDPASLQWGTTGFISLRVDTVGTLYSTGRVPFVRNETCHGTPSSPGRCVIGKDEPELFYVDNSDVEGAYSANYVLTYRPVFSTDYSKKYTINLTGSKKSAGQSHDVIIEYIGTKTGNETMTTIEIKIV